MERRVKRIVRALLGAVVAAAAAAPAAATADEIRGAVFARDGGAVPAGDLAITLEAADAPRRPLAQTRGRSDGSARTVPFVLPQPSGAAAAGRLNVVVRLERADGWLLARGSAPLDADGKVRVALDPVMY